MTTTGSPGSNQRLWDAVVAKDTEAAKAALRDGAEPNTFRIPMDHEDEPGFRALRDDEAVIYDASVCDWEDVCRQLRLHRDYVSVLMVAAQNQDLSMLTILKEAGADIDLQQPALIHGDGYAYGEMSPVCYAVHCIETTKWFVDNDAYLNFKIRGLPGYEDIPCPNYTALLLAHDLEKNEAVCRLLVTSGAHVHVVAMRNSGGQGHDTSICSYWRDVVASGDVAWAERLLKEFDADANHIGLMPIISVGPFSNTLGEHHDGLRESPLIVAVLRRDLPMIKLLLEHGAYPNEPEEFNLCDTKLREYYPELNPACSHTRDQIIYACQDRGATPFSLSLGLAQVPEAFLVYENPTRAIIGVNDPFCHDPIIAALMAAGATTGRSMDAASEFAGYTYITSSRVWVASIDIESILPTLDELTHNVCKLSAKARAAYFRVRAEKLAEGVPDELSRAQAFVTANALDFPDSDAGTRWILRTRTRGGVDA
jgi:hypothetical protein